MTPAQINKKLAEKGLRHVDIVVGLGMRKTSRPIVSMVINGNSRSRRVEQAISQHTGYPLHVLWPSWYAEPAQPKRRKVA